jgi:hypothetical protein
MVAERVSRRSERILVPCHIFARRSRSSGIQPTDDRDTVRETRPSSADVHLQHAASATITKVMSRWLGPDHCAKRLLSRGRTARGWTRADWRQFREGNLAGIGFGAKETAGGITEEPAVRIYVKRKLAHGALCSRDCVPPIVDNVATDVIEVGTPILHVRPVSFGAGISHAQGGRGSLGCVVIRPGANDRYLLSACHVLALAGAARPGDTIVEPAGINDDGSPNPTATPIAALTDFEPLRGDGAVNRFDAAIACIEHDADVTADIPLIGTPEGPPMPAVPYQSVRKYGAGTGPTIGVITGVTVRIALTLDGTTYLFTDVIEVIGAGGPFSTGGDSGALVVDAMTRRPVGLVIGGVSQRTFLSPLEPVLRRFGAQLLQ